MNLVTYINVLKFMAKGIVAACTTLGERFFSAIEPPTVRDAANILTFISQRSSIECLDPVASQQQPQETFEASRSR